MFSFLKRNAKRAIIFILVLAVISIIVITITNLAGDNLFRRKPKIVLIDSDSGNNISDIVGLSRLLVEPGIEIAGITVVHSEFAQNAGDSSLEMNYKTSQAILSGLGKENIPLYKGAETRMRYDTEPFSLKTEAAEFIIRKARETKKREKLDIITFGALTNIASAIEIDSTIVSEIRLFMLGMKYDNKYKVWNKNEFNTRNDLDALDVILNTDGLETWIMPSNTAENLFISREESDKFFPDKKGIWELISREWHNNYSGKEDLNMKEVALVEAVLNPDLVKYEETLTPPENRQRVVKAYTYLNRELMNAEFFATMIAHGKKKGKTIDQKE